MSRKKDLRFKARITVKGKEILLGRFDTAEEAHAAYLEAKRVHHPGCTIWAYPRTNLRS